jgi:hypothetical protein
MLSPVLLEITLDTRKESQANCFPAFDSAVMIGIHCIQATPRAHGRSGKGEKAANKSPVAYPHVDWVHYALP